MEALTVIIALAAMLFVFPAGAQTDWEKKKSRKERIYTPPFARAREVRIEYARRCLHKLSPIWEHHPVGFYPANPSIKFAELSINFSARIDLLEFLPAKRLLPYQCWEENFCRCGRRFLHLAHPHKNNRGCR